MADDTRLQYNRWLILSVGKKAGRDAGLIFSQYKGEFVSVSLTVID